MHDNPLASIITPTRTWKYESGSDNFQKLARSTFASAAAFKGPLQAISPAGPRCLQNWDRVVSRAGGVDGALLEAGVSGGPASAQRSLPQY